MGKGGSGSSGEQKEGWGPPVPPSCTLAVGKRGSAYWMSPWIWICMVVSERWNTVRACRREWGTVTDPPPSPRQHQGGRPPALYLLEGAAQALVTVQVIMNHLCRENRNISRSVPGHREPWRGTMAAGGIDPWVGLGVLPELASASQPALTCADLVVRLVHDELVRGHAEVAGALWGQRDVIGAHSARHSPRQPFPPLLPHSPPRPPCPRPWRPS